MEIKANAKQAYPFIKSAMNALVDLVVTLIEPEATQDAKPKITNGNAENSVNSDNQKTR